MNISTEAQDKLFDPAALASITTGILLVESFSKMAEAAEWLLGHPIWTHEYPALSDKLRAAVLTQFPDMPANKEEARVDWRKLAEDVRVRYGAHVSVKRGNSQREADPITTLLNAIGPDNDIIVVNGDGKQS